MYTYRHMCTRTCKHQRTHTVASNPVTLCTRSLSEARPYTCTPHNHTHTRLQCIFYWQEAARRNASQLDRVAGSAAVGAGSAAVGAGSSSNARGGHSLSKSNSIPVADSDDEEPSSSSAQAASSSAGGRGRARGRGAAAVGRVGARGGGAAGRGASAAGKTRQLPLSFGSQGADATSSNAASKNGAAKGKKRSVCPFLTPQPFAIFQAHISMSQSGMG